MRYAEVLLSYLEALNESQPSTIDQNILDLTINDIRNRVKLTDIKKQMYRHKNSCAKLSAKKDVLN